MRVTVPAPLPDEGDPFLTVGEIATLTGVSKMTVYRAIRTGDLVGIRIGRSFRVRDSSYRKWTAPKQSAEGGNDNGTRQT